MNNSDTEVMDHILTCENRGVAKITGVTDVDSFNELEIVAITGYGDLLIKGQSLHIESLNLDTGDLQVTGNVIALIYSEPKKSSKGIFKNLFK